METHRRLFGAADPIKREMEEHLVTRFQRPQGLNTGHDSVSHLHGDILRGNDWSMDWEDVYNGRDDAAGIEGVVAQLSQKVLN